MSQSSMDNLKGFQERIKRIEGAGHKSGRTSYKSSGEYFRKEEDRKRQRRKGRKANWGLRIVLVLAAFLGVKTYIMVSMGPAAYDARMAELQAGDKYHKAAFAVMQPDPLTAKLQELLAGSRFMDPKLAGAETGPAAPVTEAQPASEKQEAGPVDGEPASGSSVEVVTEN